MRLSNGQAAPGATTASTGLIDNHQNFPQQVFNPLKNRTKYELDYFIRVISFFVTLFVLCNIFFLEFFFVVYFSRFFLSLKYYNNNPMATTSSSSNQRYLYPNVKMVCI